MFDEKNRRKTASFFFWYSNYLSYKGLPVFTTVSPLTGFDTRNSIPLLDDVTLYLTTYCTSPVIRTPAKGFGDPRSTD